MESSETSLVKEPLAFVVFQEQSKVLDKEQIENFDCEAKHNHKGWAVRIVLCTTV